MWNKHKVQSFIPYSILLVTIYSIIPYTTPNATLINVLNITALWWFLLSLIIYIFILSKKYFFNPIEAYSLVFVKYYLVWNVLECMRGVLLIESYWDWKGLVDIIMALMVPFIAYSATNNNLLQYVLRFYFRFILPQFLIIFMLIWPDAWGYYLVPISFLIFFIPVLNWRSRLIIIFFTIVVLSSDLGARSNVIKFCVPIMLLLLYFIKSVLPLKLLELFRKMLFIAPFVLFVLAISGDFNVFRIDEYVTGEYKSSKLDEDGQLVEDNLTADTRTGLYVEVLQTAAKYNTWIFGRSPARGNETELFSSLSEITGRKERLSNEVAILNIFTWTGLVGVLLYMLVFYKASYLALNKSKNIFSKMVGLFIAFRWVFAWVEDINVFSLNTLFLWIMIGFCISRSFREMSDDEMKIWAQGIFKKQRGKIFRKDVSPSVVEIAS